MSSSRSLDSAGLIQGRRGSYRDRRWTQSGARWWLWTLAALLPELWLVFRGLGTLLAAVIAAIGFLILMESDRRRAITILLYFLFCLGDIRRLLVAALGQPTLDPMLLVGPAITILLAMPILARLSLKDPISKWMFALVSIMFLEIFNPKQGPIFVGLAGAMFSIIPVLWYWIGREYGSKQMLDTVIYRCIIPLGVCAAAMGLYQTYVGFLPWQAAWVSAVESHYHALYLASGLIRSFGFSVNSVEYVTLILMAATCSMAAFFAGRRVYALLFPFLTVAIFLSSSRTSVVKLLFSLAIAWAFAAKGGRGWVIRFTLAVAFGFGGLAYSLSHVAPDEPTQTVTVSVRSNKGSSSTGEGSSGGESAADAAAQHEIQGLAHPLDNKHSTANGHFSLFTGGLLQGFTNPIGSGLGSVTMGSGKFGGGEATSGSDDHAGFTEVDISDAFVSLGVGGLVYLYVIFLVIKRGVAFGQIAPKQISLPVIGMLAALLGSWIAAGQYAVGPTIWLIIGVLSREDSISTKSLPRLRAQAKQLVY